MTNTTFASTRSASTSSHSRSLNGEPKLYAATRKSTLYARLISRSAFRSGASKLDPTYKIVTFNSYYPWLNNSLELVLKTAIYLSQFPKHFRIDIPVPTPIRLQQPLDQRVRRMRIQLSQTLQHRLIKQTRVRA